MPRLATVRLKSYDALRDENVVYLETDDGIARVLAPIQAWQKAEMGLTLSVPDGDLEHPTVSAGIRWEW